MRVVHVVAAVTTAIALTGSVASCSTSSLEQPTDSASSSAVATGPITITARYGPVVLPATPKKIVATEGPWLDALLAVGVTPTAYIATSMGTSPRPWYADKLAGVPVIPASGNPREFPTEQVARYAPDLILADPWIGKTEQAVAGVSRLAPTIALLNTGNYLDTWTEQLTAVGAVTGRAAEAKKVLDETNAAIAASKRAHPNLTGKTGVMVQTDLTASKLSVVSDPKDPINTLFSQLGLSIPAAVSAASPSGRVELSLEQGSTLASDYLFIWNRGATLADLQAKIPGFAQLPAVRSGAVTLASTDLTLSFYSPGPLSLQWGLKRIDADLAKVK